MSKLYYPHRSSFRTTHPRQAWRVPTTVVAFCLLQFGCASYTSAPLDNGPTPKFGHDPFEASTETTSEAGFKFDPHWKKHRQCHMGEHIGDPPKTPVYRPSRQVEQFRIHWNQEDHPSHTWVFSREIVAKYGSRVGQGLWLKRLSNSEKDSGCGTFVGNHEDAVTLWLSQIAALWNTHSISWEEDKRSRTLLRIANRLMGKPHRTRETIPSEDQIRTAAEATFLLVATIASVCPIVDPATHPDASQPEGCVCWRASIPRVAAEWLHNPDLEQSCEQILYQIRRHCVLTFPNGQQSGVAPEPTAECVWPSTGGPPAPAVPERTSQ